MAAEHVLLAIEIVSQGSEYDDRNAKPAEYADKGIPHYWRVELEPEIRVHTYVLTDGAYVSAGVFGPGEQITSPVLPWVDVPVDRLVSAR